MRNGFFALTAMTGLCACGGAMQAESEPSRRSDPALVTPVALLDAALQCTPTLHAESTPVLLVHGTTTTGNEQFTSFYTPQLVARGHDVCVVTYPDRGLGDMQTSAEYVVHALHEMQARSGRKVAMIGHSQGALMPRWALKYFPSARAAVSDFIAIAGPHHGTTVASPSALADLLFGDLGLSALPGAGVPEVYYQFAPDSAFIAALNADDETPGEIEYTNLYTRFDELVQPVEPPTAALDLGRNNPRVANLLLQDLCPGHLADHFTIGTTDTLAMALAFDALTHPGPADFARAGGTDLCALLPLDFATLLMPDRATDLLTIVGATLQGGLPDLHLATQEPPLRDYAR